ncbi:MAG: quinolinate synthase NadA, partial [Armatimonadetes bacterium]|nr:quinolinate synthase NadA [Armatimonadota bacterium]
MPTALTARIAELKHERKAVILAHNYQLPEVQDIADFTGDSLGLSRQAAGTDADVIVFCGVHFMAQTAKLLSPSKTVLLPALDAGCPMADMVVPERVLALRAQHPAAPVVAYVNTSAEVKAEVDVCCTSANAVKVVEAVGREAEEVLFIPDKNLADWVSRQVQVKVIPYRGFCPTHVWITPEAVGKQRAEHPDALFMCHPECDPAVVALAEEVLSTSGMLKFARASNVREIIVGTEVGLLHPLRKDSPEKTF